MSIRLAVFDCDGTLLDSQANILRAMDLSFADAGLAAPDPHAVRRIVGLSLVEAMQALLPDAPPALHVDLAERYKNAFQRMRADNSLDPEPLFDGVRALIQRLEAEGWLLAVATGKSDRGLQLALEHHGLSHHFISLQTADRHSSKPHPSMLYQAMADAGARPEQTAIIGDTVFDMAMGVAARARPIGVSWGYHAAEELTAAGAIGVAGDTDDLMEMLLAR